MNQTCPSACAACPQDVKTSLSNVLPEEHIELLPLDLVGPYEQLEVAAQQAFAAFGGHGVDYVVHNAGEATISCRGQQGVVGLHS